MFEKISWTSKLPGGMRDNLEATINEHPRRKALEEKLKEIFENTSITKPRSIRNDVGKEAAISRHRGNYDSAGRVRRLIQLNNSFCRSETPPEGTSQSRPRFSPPRVRVSRPKCAPIWRSERELEKDQNSLTLSRGSRSLNATIQCS